MSGYRRPETVRAAQGDGWALFALYCLPCRENRYVSIEKVAARTPNVRLQDIAKRFRCRKCGARADAVALERTRHSEGYGSPTFEKLPITG